MRKIIPVERKMKDAFYSVIDGNRTVAAATIPGNSKNNEVSFARLCVHGTGSITSFPALSLHLSSSGRNKLFAFNLSPYMDRHILKPGQLSGIFFTRLQWDNQAVGTLPLQNSMMLKSPLFHDTVPCHGPQGLREYIGNMYSFMLSARVKERFDARTTILEDESQYSQNGIVVDKILTSGSQIQKTRDCKSSLARASYICRITGFPRYVDSEKLQIMLDDFQICFPSISKEHYHFVQCLQRGQDAINPLNGELFLVKDILKEPYRPCFAVLDCPTEQHFIELENNPTFKGLRLGSKANNSVTLMAHITPHDLFSSEVYQRWLEGFGDCKHLVLNDHNRIQYSRSEFQQIFTLNQISDDLFPPVFNEFFPVEKQDFDHAISGHAGLLYTMSNTSQGEWDYRFASRDIELDNLKAEITESLDKNSSIVGDVRNNIQATKDRNTPGYFPRLVVLGSGGTHTQKYRGHPGFLLMLDEKSSILLDCGELTLDRIYKVFGKKEAENVLASIKMIFLSHNHIDHHCGFLNLLERVIHAQRFQSDLGKRHKVFCLLPKSMHRSYKPFLDHLSGHFFVLCPLQTDNKELLEAGMKYRIEQSTGLTSVIPLHVSHSIVTYGISLDTKCGKRIVYSSDTLPMNRQLIKHGRNADLLIHDCLYVNEEEEKEANYRKHSTLEGALRTGKAMNAKFTLLTHFAPYLPVHPVENIPSDKAAVAYDFLTISLKDLCELPKLQPAINAVWGDSGKRDKVQRHLAKRKQRMSIAEDLAKIF